MGGMNNSGRMVLSQVASLKAGNRQMAVRSYSFVVDAWRQGEPPVQKYVEEARAGLKRLTGERTGKATGQ